MTFESMKSPFKPVHSAQGHPSHLITLFLHSIDIISCAVTKKRKLYKNVELSRIFHLTLIHYKSV